MANTFITPSGSERELKDELEVEEVTSEPEEAELARLEAAVIDGDESVTVADLTHAKERISFARLRREGAEKKAAKQRAQEADELRASTKAAVASMFKKGPYTDPLIAYDRAVAALDDLAKVIDLNNGTLDDAYRAYSAGGVAVRGWDGEIPEGHDELHSAYVDQGEQVRSVTVAGVLYGTEVPGKWVRAVVQQVAAAHRDLPLPYQSALGMLLRGDVPTAITERGL